MSYLDQFLKENTSNNQQPQAIHHIQQVYEGGAALLYQRGSVASEEGDIEDNRALSIASSKSNLSELSIVSVSIYTIILF